MKKNKMMRLASVLLVAVLLTTSVISGTFAKYVTKAEAGDDARVAKWGVEITVTGNDAFKDTYKNHEAIGAVAVGAGTSVETSGAAGDAVLAPGTDGVLATFKITGKPEVAVEVAAKVDLELGAGWTDGSDMYFPVVIKIDGSTIDVSTAADLEEVEEIVETEILKKITTNAAVVAGAGYEAKAQYAPNSDALALNLVEVTWEWAIGASNAVDDPTNVKDTYLGNNPDNVTIDFDIEITVTQID